MRTRTFISILCLASPALAQDSVSKIHGLPGDAVRGWATSEQLNDYVVDQAAIHGSSGAVFGIAPLVKASALRDTAPNFFNKQLSSQALSSLLLSSAPFARNAYSLWNSPGFGVNDDPARNDPGTPLATSGLAGYQFGWGFSEFGQGTPDVSGAPASLNNVIGGVVNFVPARPSRLYVARVAAAINGTAENCNLSQFGTGAVDELGEVCFRADGPGNGIVCGPYTGLSNNNLFRVRSLARTSMLNVLSASGGSDALATDYLMAVSPTTHNTPNQIPPAVAGRPVLIASNFNKEYVFEQVAGSTVASAAGAHFALGVTDHRGAVGYAPLDFPTLFPGSTSGTAGILAYTTSGVADALNLWGLASDGSFLAPRAVLLPSVISDPAQPSWSNTIIPGSQQFDHYHSQTAFRGGSSQVALGTDQAGDLLAAAVVYYASPVVPPSLTANTNRNNYIAVSKTTPAGVTTWSVAGWVAESTPGAISDGKTIFQNGTTAIGRLSGAAFGPCLSAPMIDSVGNVWFLGELTLNAQPGVTTVGLLRAVLDPASFSYKLELVFKQGDVIHGRNSALDYQIRFLEISDGDSVSSGTAYSANISSASDQNISTAGLSTDDARTLGGMLIHASVIYDVDGDGQFIRSTGTGGVPGSPDEDYEVLLYLSASRDCNGNGIPDDSEIADGTSNDLDANGVPDQCQGLTGITFCNPGTLGVQACPCANPPSGANRGCDNSAGTGGASIGATGLPSLGADSVVFATAGQRPNGTTILLQGTTQLAGGSVFGQGVRCVGGVLKRLYVKSASGGSITAPGTGDPGVSARSAALGDAITAGSQRYYLAYYRDPIVLGGCSVFSTYNATNGFTVQWLP